MHGKIDDIRISADNIQFEAICDEVNCDMHANREQ